MKLIIRKKVFRSQSMTESDEEFIDRKPYFEPFNKKTTHWAEPTHRPKIPNVAYVLPPNLQGSMLRLALFRMQIEENAFQIEHQEEEASYSIWKESFIDAKSWFNNIPLAVKEKSREILAREIKTTITSFDQEFPSILKRPTLHPSYRHYHLYKPDEASKTSKPPFLPKVKNDFSNDKYYTNTNTNSEQHNNNSSESQINNGQHDHYDDELLLKKEKSIYDDYDNQNRKNAFNDDYNDNN